MTSLEVEGDCEVDKSNLRTLIGYLRSLDQFGNLLLTQTIERIHVKTKYGDIDRGNYRAIKPPNLSQNCRLQQTLNRTMVD